MIDRATIDKIMDTADIVDVVSDFVSLHRAGVNYKGLCPFHDDKTPSFIVSPSKGICHCFACGKGGNVVGFIMEHEQLSYPEALRYLARKYNIEIAEREMSAEEKAAEGEREALFAINEWAKTWFADILAHDQEGLAIGKQYFRSRGIRDDIIQRFALGYAPARRDALATAAKAKGFREDYIVKTGLCYRRDDGTLVDRYAGRVIFPWIGVSGKATAFGGRLLDSRTKGVQQKYVNSPESDLFHKDHELYGLFQAKRAIGKEDSVYMVEGYTDVIAMHQAGIENVVANSGTALSVHQIHLLHRFTPNIVLLYDGDEAGIHAALRGTDMLLGEGMNVRVLTLPDGDDPDSYARKHGADKLREYIATHQRDFIQFKTEQLLNGVDDPVKRSEAIASIVKSVSVIPNQLTRDAYIHDCSVRLAMAERTLVNAMNDFIRASREDKAKEAEREQRRAERVAANIATPQPEQTRQQPAAARQSAAWQGAPQAQREIEKMLIEYVLKFGDRIIYEGVETGDGRTINLNIAQYVSYDLGQDNITFSVPLYNDILAEAVSQSDKESFQAEQYFARHHNADISRMACNLSFDRYQLSQSLVIDYDQQKLRQDTEHLVLDLRYHIVKQRLTGIKQGLATAGDKLMDVLKEFRDTQTLLAAIAKQLGRDLG